MPLLLAAAAVVLAAAEPAAHPIDFLAASDDDPHAAIAFGDRSGVSRLGGCADSTVCRTEPLSIQLQVLESQRCRGRPARGRTAQSD